jgi:hypothetical protein
MTKVADFHPIRSRDHFRRGVVIMWIILAIPAVLTLLILVLEISNLWFARIELEDTLEAAALAGVKTWSEGGAAQTPDPHDDPDDPALLASVRTATQALAAANTINGVMFSLDPNSGSLPHENGTLTGDILLGGFPDNVVTGIFDSTANVGCGRTEIQVTIVTLNVAVLIDTGNDPGNNDPDTSTVDNAFRIEISDDTPAFAGSVTSIELDLRNPDADATYWLNALEPDDAVFQENNGGTPNEANGFGPVIGSDSEVTAFDPSDPYDVSADGSVLTLNFVAGAWTTDGTKNLLTFGIDTDGVGPGSPTTSPADQGGAFGDNGAASARPGRFRLRIGVDGFPLNDDFAIESLQPNGATRSRLQGAAEKIQGTFQTIIVVPNRDFAVLTQKTWPVQTLCERMFGVTIGPFNVSARATATARCVNASATDPDVNSPRLVHTTEIQ